MPVVMDDEEFASFLRFATRVPSGDLVRPGWWVEGGEFVRPDDPYPTLRYERYGPFDSQAEALVRRNELDDGRWRVVHTAPFAGSELQMLPVAHPLEYERL